MRRLYEKNLTTSYGGNISIRYGKYYLISETCIDKSLIKPNNISLMTFDDKNINGIKPSSEFMIHRMVYQNRPDINAIIHAHPPYATAFALSNQRLNSSISSEMYKNLGNIVIAEYAKPGSKDLADIVAAASRKSNSIIMSNHGVIVLSSKIDQAFYMIELMEQLAQMQFIINSIGKEKSIPTNQLTILGE